jgi:hypothetical protein
MPNEVPRRKTIDDIFPPEQCDNPHTRLEDMGLVSPGDRDLIEIVEIPVIPASDPGLILRISGITTDQMPLRGGNWVV